MACAHGVQDTYYCLSCSFEEVGEVITRVNKCKHRTRGCHGGLRGCSKCVNCSLPPGECRECREKRRDDKEDEEVSKMSTCSNDTFKDETSWRFVRRSEVDTCGNCGHLIVERVVEERKLRDDKKRWFHVDLKCGTSRKCPDPEAEPKAEPGE